MFCLWKGSWENLGWNSGLFQHKGYYKAQRSMRKCWSSGIFFMPHPTKLGACRRWQLLKDSMTNSVVHASFLCLIKGARNRSCSTHTDMKTLGLSLIIIIFPFAHSMLSPCPLCHLFMGISFQTSEQSLTEASHVTFFLSLLKCYRVKI